MKKIFILLHLIATQVVFSQSNYNLKFDENEFSFLETEIGYQIVSKSADYYLLSDTVLPALPYKNIFVLIPENTNIENVTISVKSKEIRQDIYLIKNSLDEPISKKSRDGNSGNYLKAIYPDKNLNFETIIKSQGFYMAAFSVCPFIYNVQKRSLEFITEMNISFDQTTAKSISSGVKRYDMEDFVKSLVINPEEMNMLYSQIGNPSTRSTSNDVEYLIITSENLKNSFNPLKAWKIRKGLKTEIVTTESIYANYTGATNQLKIKECLRDYYENKNLKWALLGGDNTVVPVQACYQIDDSIDIKTPCDLFYACFDNAFDWDANKNGKIGEAYYDSIDMDPEIYISRAPIRTVEHVNAFINKTIAYETSPPISDYVKTILLTGTNMFGKYINGESDAHMRSEYMYLDYIAPYWADAVKTKFYDTGTDFPGNSNYDVTAANLQTVLNNGYHFVHMATHGNQTIWAMETGSDYSTTNAQNQINSKPSIIITIACLTNAFDDLLYTDDPCLSEALIRNPHGGCVLYWGSSRYGFEKASSDLRNIFFQLLFSGFPSVDAYKFGVVTAIAKTYFIPYSLRKGDAFRSLQFAQNAIGDPELSIYTENPTSFTNAKVYIDGSSVTVNANVPGCTIVLSSVDNGQSYFEVAKNVSSHVFTNVSLPINVTITKHNYIPYLEYVVCETTNFTNQTINTDTTVIDCNIKVKNVTVKKNAKLILEAEKVLTVILKLNQARNLK